MSVFTDASNILKGLQAKATSVIPSIQKDIYNWGVQNPQQTSQILQAPRQIQQTAQRVTNFVANQPIINNPTPFKMPFQSPTVGQVIPSIWQVPLAKGEQIRSSMINPNFQTKTPVGVGKLIFGNQPIQNFPSQIKQVYRGGVNLGLPKPLAGIGAIAGVGAISALDLMPVTGGAKASLAKLASKSRTAEEFASLVSKDKNLVRQVSTIIKDTKNPLNSIQDVFNSIKKPVANAGLTSEQKFQILQDAHSTNVKAYEDMQAGKITRAEYGKIVSANQPKFVKTNAVNARLYDTAKQYKSAKEFSADLTNPSLDWEAPQINVVYYHGDVFNNGSALKVKEGLSLSPDSTFAKQYANRAGGEGATVRPFQLNENAKVLDLTNKGRIDGLAMEKAIQQAKSGGYDAVRFETTSPSGLGSGEELHILNPKSVQELTKPKLEAIYNQSRVAQPTTQTTGLYDAGKTGVTNDIVKAIPKYKNADDFAKNVIGDLQKQTSPLSGVKSFDNQDILNQFHEMGGKKIFSAKEALKGVQNPTSEQIIAANNKYHESRIQVLKDLYNEAKGGKTNLLEQQGKGIQTQSKTGISSNPILPQSRLPQPTTQRAGLYDTGKQAGQVATPEELAQAQKGVQQAIKDSGIKVGDTLTIQGEKVKVKGFINSLSDPTGRAVEFTNGKNIPLSRVAQLTISDASGIGKGTSNQGVEQTVKELTQQAETSTKQTILPKEPVVSPQIEGGNLTNGGGKPSSPNIISQDPVQKIIQALKEAKPIRGQQEALYAKARAQRVARVASAGQRVGGEAGFHAQLGALKGELPKVQFEGIRNKLTQEDINSVFNTVEKTPYFSPFEKVTAKQGLAKLLGKEGGVVPTKGELSLLNEIFPPEFIKAAEGNKTLLQKIWGGIGQVAAVPRSLMAGGLDMSYGLRQGVFSGYSHPKQFAAAFKDQFKNFASESAYRAGMDAIKNDPLYKLSREAGVSITDLGGGLGKREEQFQSALAEKIPVVGGFVRASGRAYTGFANKYRFDMFKSLVENAKKTGDFKDPKFLKNAGEFVNTVTGRGSLGKFEKQAGVLSSTLFSPRLLASRLQLLNPQFYMKLQPAVRKEALKSLVGYVAGTTTILGAAKMAGADVSTDPTSSDFAKIKVGNTRIDIMGGFQQPIVLLARLLTGKVTSSTTGKQMTLGEGYKPLTRFDIVQRFFESKEAPIVSFISSAIKGQDAIGNQFNLPTEVINRMIPMFISDMVDLYKEGGLSFLPLGIPSFFGAGSQTYGRSELVSGKNQLGQPTSQIRQVPSLASSITEKAFGQQPLGSSSNADITNYYDQLKAMPRDQANAKYFEIVKTNPDLAKKLVQVARDRKRGITVDDQVIKGMGVASGDRAKAIADKFNSLKTREEKIALYDHYTSIGIITPEIYKQLKLILKK